LVNGDFRNLEIKAPFWADDPQSLVPRISIEP